MNRQPTSLFAARPTALQEWQRGGSVVASAHVGMATGAGLYFYTSSLFVIPLSEQYGWSRGDIAMGAALGLLGSLTAPLIGRLTDRFGARIIAAISFVMIAAVFAVMSQMPGPYIHFVLLSALFGIVAPGATGMTFSRAVTGWFERARGQALGIMAAGASIGALLFTPLIAHMIWQYGPEGGLLTLAALAAFLGAPVILVGLKDRVAENEVSEAELHEESGTGALGSLAAIERSAPASRSKIWASLRSRSFIALALAVFVTNIPTSGILTQLEPLLRHNGIERTAPLIAMYSVVVLIARIGIGWLFDRTDARYVAAVVTMAAAAGCLMFYSGAPGWMVIMGIVCVGLMQGLELDAIGYFVGRHFDRDEFGLMFGMLLTISLLGTALGVVGFGMLYDATLSYDLALTLAAGGLVVALAAYLSIPREAE
ncbi:hypothetical protein A9995_09725 [Erythrobacter sp. QSSC1-22B]|uniref:MFS transporter n=1 Tax=Erythrobacter sp. QSSC1-22B TaxID=1860125 RepID=UPI0008051F9E|nr:MFS transporter [Erythrobacter sp. QSSC1-22B]OBX18829.1 hypothetical protein A9995_09725 [Erythrobacter sp. QSSC1-22B]